MKLSKEINIVEIIKSQRYFNAALRFLLSKPQRMKLKERGRYTTIDPDVEEVVKALENSGEHTEGFYSSESDAFVPDDAGGGQESHLVEQH